jgi:Fe-S-cluster-containing dehydrogenase component
MFGYEFYVDPSRCIGCRSCVTACAECDSHRGVSMIYVDDIARSDMIGTVPMVCMHCEEPTCALVCPADAIKRGEDGVVRSALKPRCIACSNCVLACPFGVPKVHIDLELMMKCDMCYDRTSVGLRPMCATVCPSQALAYVPREQIARERRETPVNLFRFGGQEVRTKVQIMLPSGSESLSMDVADYTWEEEHARGESSEETFVV